MPGRHPRTSYPLALALCALTLLVALPLRGWLDLANIVMLFLLAVFVAAIRLGRGPAVLTAVLGVALFDFFFVPPQLSFTVADAQYVVTLAAMLAVGLIASHLAARLGERTEAAQSREEETQALYQLARDLGATLDLAQVVEVLERFLGRLGLDCALLISESIETPERLTPRGGVALGDAECALAGAAYRRNETLEPPTPGAGRAAVFLPFSGNTRVRGVLALLAPAGGGDALAGRRPLLTAVASLVGIAVERLHFADIAQQSELNAKTEQLRASILAAISHDLRTPLTSLIGLADSLADSLSNSRAGRPPGEAGETAGAAAETAALIREQAHAMHRMVSNVLEMARLQSGRVKLNRQWQPLDDVVGSSLRLLGELLARRRLSIALAADLPLVCFDAVLVERLLCNLLENAVKYSADGARIELAAAVGDGRLNVSVCNEGAGFPEGQLDQVFELFVRGAQEAAAPGTGIGLAICRAIVAAHDGSIVAENRPGQACVRFVLPQATPPSVDGEWA